MAAPVAGVYRRLFSLIRPYRAGLSVAVVLGLISSGLALAQPMVIGALVGKIVAGAPATVPALALGGLFLTDLVIGGVEVYLLGRAGASLVLDSRRRVVRRLLRAPLGLHLRRQRGDLFTAAVADTDLLKTSLMQGLLNLVVSALMVVGSVVLMTVIDPVLTLSTLAVLLLSGMATLIVAKRVRAAGVETRERVGDFASSLQRAIGAIRTVKLSRAEEREEARIGEFAGAAFHTGMRGVRLESAMAPIMNLGIQGSFAAVFTVGAFRLAGGSVDTAHFSSYLLYLLYLIAPLISLFTAFAQIQLGFAAMLRVDAVADVPEETGGTSEPKPMTGTALSFEDVTFGYQPGVPTVRGLTFDIPRRGFVAVVGPSGAGKSTIFTLVERLWDVDSGRILLAGQDIRDLSLRDLRGRVGYVEQDAPVVDGTIRENLVFAKPDATEEQLADAVAKANLRRWIDGLEHGLDTEVGESGTAISGGERQRIAIARMLLLRPEILLLDEATSQLDTEAEIALGTSIAAVSADCAVLAIAHRMATVVAADRILVVDEGRLQAVGDHESLVATNELYQRLVRTQLGGTEQGNWAVETELAGRIR
ncbi:ABC transporter ATP-binding protein [Amycolatopsis sp. CA-230715]|uniref:ABC transporter ATP-binding protein n=1 Tax=Amycolatopsis sp. CA-230715 TaxID=2745196 RepID=UPI001C027806|nr:ABC transporter ATP-binding protein [Amycolatopsis sp. CA-230715]QWF82482.1 Putative multidrug export ATP-binding/permease protein [Amycolatopsis sp. CA-230715]